MGPYFEKERDAQVDRLVELAAACDLKPGQLALAWILRKSEVSSVLCGATRLAQVEQNAAAADAGPPADVLAELDNVFAAD